MFTYKFKPKPLKKFLPNTQQFIVYKHTNTINGKCYVGLTFRDIKQRWSEHCAKANDESQYNFHKAIRKYGVGDDIWHHEILEVLNIELYAKASEIFWIDFYNSMKYGYNMTSGGDGIYNPNAETRWRIGSGNRGKKFDDEYCERISIGTKAAMTSEVRELISVKTKEALDNPISKKKISDAFYRRPIEQQKRIGVITSVAINQYDLKTGEFIATYESIKQACDVTGANGNSIIRCCTGEYKHAKGFKWRYIRDLIT